MTTWVQKDRGKPQHQPMSNTYNSCSTKWRWCTLQNLQLQQELAESRKMVNRGRPPCLGPWQDWHSVPRPPNYQGPPDYGPTGSWAVDQPPPLAGIKPTLLSVPSKFKGEHDDINRFLGDCQTYFKMFRQYFPLHSQMVVFAASLLEGPAQDWWVHLQDTTYWYVPHPDNLDEAGPRYWYPHWGVFIEIFHEQFRWWA